VPIYDYVCSSCSTRTEFIHGIDAEAPRFCPACGAEATLRKAFVAPSVHFKGSGWAKKDRMSSSTSKAKAAAAESSDGAGSPGEGGSRGGKGSDGGDAKGAESSGASGSKKVADTGASKGASAPASGEG
jgi:putative FmdB family regulatory protein